MALETTTPPRFTQPEPASPPAKSSTAGFDEEMLSPVSKLELARKYAAAEQQKRIEAACTRMVEVKKDQLLKREAIEARLDTHIKNKHNEDNDDSTARSSRRLSSIAMRLVDAFKGTTEKPEDEEHVHAANPQDEETDSYSPTRQLLRATRNKLNALAASQQDDEDDSVMLPATNYHLKQMGLTNEKINIYAPIEEQRQEIRRRRASAIRCQQKYMEELESHASTADAYNSAEDSDFVPEDDDDEDADDDLSDDDASDDDDEVVEEVGVDQDEVRRLVEDQQAFDGAIVMYKRSPRASKKRKSKSAKKSLMQCVAGSAIIAVFLALVLALVVAFAEHQTASAGSWWRSTPTQTISKRKPVVSSCRRKTSSCTS
ncbi:hypothetical protein PINS_up000123 [Pythium insidiosum]|nr:hypothetical protein PINS_up000123 [Pythium insidiosum]